MNNDRISAWADDELAAQEIDGLKTAFDEDGDDFIQRMQLYSLIGTAMRKEISVQDTRDTVPLKAIHARLDEEPTVKLPWWQMLKFPLREMWQQAKVHWMPAAAAIVVIGGLWIVYPKNRDNQDITMERVREVAFSSTMGAPLPVSVSAAQRASDAMIKQYVSAHQDVSPLAVFEGDGFALMRASINPRDTYAGQ